MAGYPPKRPTQSQIDQAVRDIRNLLAEGHGIVMSRRLAGISNYDTFLARGVRVHPEYLPMLNEYMKKIGKPVTYELINGKLKSAKRGKNETNQRS